MEGEEGLDLPFSQVVCKMRCAVAWLGAVESYQVL
jgi:hypothetical protein